MSIYWEHMLPALVHDPWYILKGTFVFVVALVTLPALLYKISVHGVAIIAFAYLMLHEVSEYFFPDPQQLNHVLAETSAAEQQNVENNSLSLRPYANDNRTTTVATLLGRMIDSRGRLLWILLKRDFDLTQDPVIVVRNCLKLLFLILAVTGAILVATVPAVSAWGIFGYITQTLMTIGVSTPGVLSIGQVGVTFGVIYASRTFSIGIGLLLGSVFKSGYLCIKDCIQHYSDRNIQSSSLYERIRSRPSIRSSSDTKAIKLELGLVSNTLPETSTDRDRQETYNGNTLSFPSLRSNIRSESLIEEKGTGMCPARIHHPKYTLVVR